MVRLCVSIPDGHRYIVNFLQERLVVVSSLELGSVEQPAPNGSLLKTSDALRISHAFSNLAF